LKKDSKNKQVSQYVEINDAEKYFLPFELACKSKSPRVVEAALDCIQVRSSLLFYFDFNFYLIYYFFSSQEINRSWLFE
jgi:hypothetical protein